MDKEQKRARTASRRKRKHSEDLLDEALSETFPASDPISVEVLREEAAEVKHADRKIEK